MIKIKTQNTQDKFAKKVFSKYEKTKSQKKETLVQKLQNKYAKTMMPVGSVTRLDGYWKKKYENFLGVDIPTVRLHKTDDSIAKSKEYQAHSYAQGADIYFGKDTPSLETVEGQALLGHEITHILQQKYLDMSSNKQMVDPSVLLERKAGVVEDRIRFKKGLDEDNGGYFRKWDILPSRSYLNTRRDNVIIQQNIIKQRKKNLLNTLRDSSYRQTKAEKHKTHKNKLLADDAVVITPESKYEDFKVTFTEQEFNSIKTIADKDNKAIFIRESSKRAKELREEYEKTGKGAHAKPSSIQQNTQKDDDHFINPEYKKEDLAKVVVYKPIDEKTLLSSEEFGNIEDPEKRVEILQLRNKRQENWDNQKEFLHNNPDLEIKNGLILNKTDKLSYTSDHDVRNIEEYDKNKVYFNNTINKKQTANEKRDAYVTARHLRNNNKTNILHNHVDIPWLKSLTSPAHWNEYSLNKLGGLLSNKKYRKNIDFLKSNNNVKSKSNKEVKKQRSEAANEIKKRFLIHTPDNTLEFIKKKLKSNPNNSYLLSRKKELSQLIKISKKQTSKIKYHNKIEDKKKKNKFFKKIFSKVPNFREIWDKIDTKTKQVTHKFTQKSRDKELNKLLKQDLKANKSNHKKDKILNLRDNVFDNYLNISDNPVASAFGAVGNYYEYKKLSVDGRTKEGKEYKRKSQQFYKSADSASMFYGDAQKAMGVGSELLELKDKIKNGNAGFLDYTSVIGDTFQTGGGILKDITKHTSFGKKYLDKFKLSKKFGHISNKFSFATDMFSLGSGVKDMIDGKASLSQSLYTAQTGIGVLSNFSNSKVGKKLLKKLPKNGMLGKASKFITFIQSIVGIIDSGILTQPLKLAQMASSAIGGFVSSLGGKIGGKVIASTVAAITGGIGALLYPVTSYFGGMLAESGLSMLYEKYAKTPITQRIFEFAKDGIEHIEENYPTVGHLINGRYSDFLSSMLSYINPTAIFSFVDNFMEDKFPIVWKGVKFGAEAVGQVATKAWDITKSAGSSIVDGISSIGSGTVEFASNMVDKFQESSVGKAVSKTLNVVTNISSKAIDGITNVGKGALNIANNTINKVGGFIGSLFGSSSEDVKQPIQNSIVEKQEPKEESSWWKFAKTSRHQNQPINKQVQINQLSQQTNAIDNMNDKIDELAQKIFRQLKNDVALEYARVGI